VASIKRLLISASYAKFKVREKQMGFIDRVTPVVDETIRILAKTKFVEDPIAGKKYSRATSIVSSAYKRHGRILETALRESSRESNRHHVWQDDAFKVSASCPHGAGR
jgi:hypothetical protein